MTGPHRNPGHGRERIPRELSATEFEARCLELMDQVQRTRSEVIVTKHGKPVAKLTAIEERAPSIFGLLAGTVRVHDDLTEPAGARWEADQ